MSESNQSRPSPRGGWSIRKLVRTARRYRIIRIQGGARTITAADPLPPTTSAKPSKRSTTPADLLPNPFVKSPG